MSAKAASVSRLLHPDGSKYGEVAASLGASAAALACSLVVAGVIIVATGHDLVSAYRALVDGALTGPGGLGATLTYAAPLIFVGAGTAFAFRSGAFNIGGEGQIYLGALGAALVGLYLPSGGGSADLVVALIAAAAFGAGWSLLAGAIRVTRGPHEVVVTLLLNFIGILLVRYLVQGPMAQAGRGFPESPPIHPGATLPMIWSKQHLHLGVVLASLAAVGVFLILWHTPLGFAARCVGSGGRVARYVGVAPSRVFLMAMGLSGALAGLAGAVQTLGTFRHLEFEVSDGIGFEGIAVALVARLNPVGAIVSGVFFGALRAGAVPMQLQAGVPSALVTVIQGLAILFIIVGHSLAERIRFARASRRARVGDRRASGPLGHATAAEEAS